MHQFEPGVRVRTKPPAMRRAGTVLSRVPGQDGQQLRVRWDGAKTQATVAAARLVLMQDQGKAAHASAI